MNLPGKTRKPLVVAAGYFVVFFSLLLSYRFINATFIDHVPFEFDMFQNLGVPAFTAVVGYVTAAFGRR